MALQDTVAPAGRIGEAVAFPFISRRHSLVFQIATVVRCGMGMRFLIAQSEAGLLVISLALVPGADHETSFRFAVFKRHSNGLQTLFEEFREKKRRSLEHRNLPVVDCRAEESTTKSVGRKSSGKKSFRFFWFRICSLRILKGGFQFASKEGRARIQWSEHVHIESIPIERIQPAAYNPRLDLQPGDSDYDKLKRSLDEFGCVEPVVWNRRTGHLVGGHQRLKVLQARGDQHVDASVVDLSLEKEQALNVALNKIGGDWDEAKLADLLTHLGEIPDFNVGLTGFDATEITDLFDRLEAGDTEDDFDLADALDVAQGTPAITQPGELLELGRHRLLCGDSSKPQDVERLLNGEKVDLVFTDPPYNVNYYGGNRPAPRQARPKRSREWKRIYMDDLSQADYERWLGQVFQNMLSAMATGAPYYIWNGHRQFGPMYALLSGSGAHVSCVVVWAKESFAIGFGDYSQQTEFCLYGWLANDRNTRRTAHRWYGPSNESTLWQIHRDRTREYRHPTQKPLALAERALRNSSRRGELVLDLFLGSGSTLIAAGRLERRCFGLEIDPRYCDAIVRRYLALMGDDAPKELRDRYVLPMLPSTSDSVLTEVHS